MFLMIPFEFCFPYSSHKLLQNKAKQLTTISKGGYASLKTCDYKHFLIPLLIIVIVIYWATSYSTFQLVANPNNLETDMEVAVKFYIPMRQEDLTEKITVTPELPHTLVYYKVRWSNSTTAILHLNQTGYPRGQLLNIKITGAKTIIPFIKKNISTEIRPQLPLKLISKTHPNNIPSRGPLTIDFNTPVNPDSLKSSVVLPAPGRLEPVKLYINNKSYTNFSRWSFYPDKPLRQGANYKFVLKQEICSIGGSKLQKNETIYFNTATAPRVISTLPEANASEVKLYRSIKITTDKPLNSASIEVIKSGTNTITPGKVEVKGNNVIFHPSECFLPNQSYKVRLTGKSHENEPIDEYIYFFTTVDMGDRYWVDVNLSKKHTMTVYRGNKVIRTMLASGGKSTTPSPLGYFYTQDRGHSFWSPRFGEGATYWVRLVGQVLVHSVPRDHRWQVKEEEHEKLGLPASHGCVRLSEQNAKWFFENIPTGTLVIIHE